VDSDSCLFNLAAGLGGAEEGRLSALGEHGGFSTLPPCFCSEEGSSGFSCGWRRSEGSESLSARNSPTKSKLVFPSCQREILSPILCLLSACSLGLSTSSSLGSPSERICCEVWS